jgi:hypothetical protein
VTEADAKGDVPPVVAYVLGLIGFAVSGLAFLFIGYSLSLVVGAASDGQHPLLFPVGISTFAIACLNMANTARFMAQKRWRPFLQFLALSTLALGLLALLWIVPE